jgi:HD-like signal output (HDOD) protein
MNSTRTPQTWLMAMGAAELPVLDRTVLELARLREDIDRVTTQQLAEIVMHDPIMTFKVLRYIQQRRTLTLRVDVTTIAHALMMLGMNPFLDHFSDQETLQARLAPLPDALTGALSVISRARHAAMYARDWALVRHDIEVDEVTTAALLHDLAELLIWIHKPEIAVSMHERQREQHARSEAVQREILGFPLNELQLELAHKWQLPDLLSELMDERHAHTPRAVNVVVAVALARHSANGWDDAALPDDFAAVGRLLGLEPAAARERVLRTALKVARDWEWYGVPPAASLLPLLAA